MISPLENAAQWMAMLDAGVFANQSALASAMGCHRGTVSRAVLTARALLTEPWIERLVRPVMHEFTGRSADRLADACADEARRDAARERARNLSPGVPADSLYRHLFADGAEPSRREPVFVRRKGRAGGGVVAVKIERDGAGGFSVNVRPHEQTPAERAELAEQIEALVAAETAGAGNVRLGRRLAGSLTAQHAKDVHRSWLEGCIWAAARASGLEWDQWRCAVAAEVLRSQQDGWKRAVVQAVDDADADADGRNSGRPGQPGLTVSRRHSPCCWPERIGPEGTVARGDRFVVHARQTPCAVGLPRLSCMHDKLATMTRIPIPAQSKTLSASELFRNRTDLPAYCAGLLGRPPEPVPLAKPRRTTH